MTMTRDQALSGKTIFYSIAAQPDNLGDIVIRKVVASWLMETGLPVTVFAGTMPPGYIEAFDFPPDVPIVRSSRAFQLLLGRQVLRRRAHLVFAPGPQGFGTFGRAAKLGTPRRQFAVSRSLAKPLLNLVTSIAVRASGGRAVAIARAARGQGRLALTIEQARIRALDAFSTRDTASSAVLGLALRVVPDVAFFEDHGDHDNGTKDVIVISVRGDRPANLPAIRDAVTLCRRLGLRPVILTQVKSDQGQHEAIARETDTPLVAWEDETHTEQLERALETYRQARFVISDRLHALIFGAQHGAVPIAIVHPDTDKLTATLRHIVPLGEVDSRAATWTNLEAILTDETSAGRLRQATAAARADLLTLRSDIQALLR